MTNLTTNLLLSLSMVVSTAAAQPDSVYLQYPSVTGHCRIYIPLPNGNCRKENYFYFKYMYSLVSVDTLSSATFQKLRNKHAWTKRTVQLAACDRKVNRIRNEGAMALVYNNVSAIAKQRLGSDNWFNRNHVFHWLALDNLYEPYCPNEFHKVSDSIRNKWLMQIDSVAVAVQNIGAIPK